MIGLKKTYISKKKPLRNAISLQRYYLQLQNNLASQVLDLVLDSSYSNQFDKTAPRLFIPSLFTAYIFLLVVGEMDEMNGILLCSCNFSVIAVTFNNLILGYGRLK